jgi:transcriptional regulator with XRE-family HTH domain
MASFGQRLRKLRNNKNITQKELAKILKISESAIGMYERDEREPSFEIVRILADYFHVSTDYLLCRTDNPNYISDQENENLFFFDKEGLTDEDIEYLKQSIEIMKERARRRAEEKKKKNNNQ